MTNKDKEEIAVLRRQGLGYKKIAAQLDIPLGTVKTHCIRHNLQSGDGSLCIQCGLPLTKAKTGRPRKFCSSKCRNEYWHAHTIINHNCICCGKEFNSRVSNAKYCSHECYIKFRFRGKLDE